MSVVIYGGEACTLRLQKKQSMPVLGGGFGDSITNVIRHSCYVAGGYAGRRVLSLRHLIESASRHLACKRSRGVIEDTVLPDWSSAYDRVVPRRY